MLNVNLYFQNLLQSRDCFDQLVINVEFQSTPVSGLRGS